MEVNNINYKFILNKVFTGSYLEHNLGHELINFIKFKNNKRFVYLNPWGERGKMAAENTEYAFHVMGIKYDDEKYYELVAVSKIKKGADTLYNEDKAEERKCIKKNDIIFEGHSLSEIFPDSKSHLYSFITEKFYKPKKGIRIFFHVGSKENVSNKPELLYEDPKSKKKVFKINVSCNLQRSRCYSKEFDIKVLEDLVTSNKYIEENDDDIILNNDEQCFAVISDRTNLEDSMSNQIAYFLNRDKNILSEFIKLLNKHLDNDKINKDEKFEILREHNHIDLLLKSEKYVVVIENKIDSNINGIKSSGSGKKKSQLSKYYADITEKQDFKDQSKHFFILEPEYSSITRKKLDEEFENGENYNIIHYNKLYEVLKNVEYNPFGKQTKKDKEKSNFLYQQFLEGIKYVGSSKAEQMQEIAYIRLKQKIEELDAGKN